MVMSAVENDSSISLSRMCLLVTPTVNIITPSSSVAEYGGFMKPTVTTVCVCVCVCVYVWVCECVCECVCVDNNGNSSYRKVTYICGYYI